MSVQLVFRFPHTGQAQLIFGRQAAGPSSVFISAGPDHAGLGGPLIGYRVRHLPAQSIAGLAWGSASIFNRSRALPTNAWDSLFFSQPTILNRNRFITGVTAGTRLQWGGPRVDNLDRYLRPTSVGDASRHGATQITHGLRRVWPTSIAPLNVPVSHWASHSPRRLLPTGWVSLHTGLPTAAASRRLLAHGFEATAWGTRITPAPQRVELAGWPALAFGVSNARNRDFKVDPKGWQTTIADLRFGRATAFNRVQRVLPYVDDYSENAGEVWGRWTEIRNRNRVIGPNGYYATQFPLPFIDNKARAINPPGAVPPALWPSATFISHGVRRISPPGIESLSVSPWARTYNGAQVVSMRAIAPPVASYPSAANTRRYIRWITADEQQLFGLPFISPRRREITFESRYTIAPPAMALPYVGNYSRPLGPAGIEPPQVGGHALEVVFRKVFPRWTVKDEVGKPAARNLTPEVRSFGRDFSEWGGALVRTQWREVRPYSFAGTMGRPIWVGDNRQTVVVMGVVPPAIPISHQAIKLKDDPPYVQRLLPGAIAFNANEGYGLGKPGLNQQVIGARSQEAMTQWGTPAVYQNALRVEPGIWDHLFGQPWVSLKHRRLEVGKFSEVFEPPKISLAPQTLWAVVEAPAQAIANHSIGAENQLHYVNSDVGRRPPGEVFGNAALSLRHRTIRPASVLAPTYQVGVPATALRRQYLYPEPTRPFRAGATRVLGGDQLIEQRESGDSAELGGATISHVVVKDNTIRPSGIYPRWESQSRIEMFNRPLGMSGWDSAELGTRKPGDTPYMWQGLYVGPVVPVRPKGDVFSAWGLPWLSHRIREVKPGGEDMFVCGYDMEHFEERMRVSRTALPMPVARSLGVSGWRADRVGTPDVRRLTSFVRPDGWADMFRGVGRV